GTADTSEKVSGKGIKKLSDVGCEVKTGVIEADCRSLNRRFFAFHEKKRPYITLKWAQSADGYLDILRSEDHKAEPTWITGKPERVLVHKWRASEQAILVGAGTIRADDPSLNVREWKGNNPLKLILSGSGSINKGSVFDDTDGKVVLFTHNNDADIPDVAMVKLRENEPSSFQIAEYLYSSGIQSLLIEGGAEVLNHFITTGLWDEARIFTGKVFFKQGVRAPLIKGIQSSKTYFSGSCLEIYLKNAS
ncbi:MAG TPA: dihydrofolate reductase family protein, partial [Bacteroidales bacterium]